LGDLSFLRVAFLRLRSGTLCKKLEDFELGLENNESRLLLAAAGEFVLQ
jgi:hypothetical protein